MPSFFIHLAPVVDPQDLEADDQGLAGIYQVDVERDETDPHTITAVLDAFHDKIGIGNLDDFEVGVKNEADEWVYESDNEDDPDPEDMPRTSFQGGVDGVPERSSCQFPRSAGKLSP